MEEFFHKARQIISLEADYEQNIKPQFPQTSFAEWILSSQSVNSMDEFHTLFIMGKVLAICDNFGLPKNKQPCNFQQHFQLLQRYINTPNLLISIWQNALRLAGNDAIKVNLSHLTAVSQQHHTTYNNHNAHNTHNNVTYNNQIIINNTDNDTVNINHCNINKKKRGRKKGTTNRSNKVPDKIIIEFWKQNPTKTLLSVQHKYNAGYNRVKRLKEIALAHMHNNNHNYKQEEGKKSEFARAAYESVQKNQKRRAAWIQKTYKALEYLKKDICAYFFLKPVDKELCRAYDYDLVITQPMDFETLENNLNNNKYLNLAEFINDFELIFINAKIYNPPNHSVHRAAENLQKLFKLNFQSIIGEHADRDTLDRWNYLDRPGGFQYGHQHYIQHQSKKIQQKRKVNQQNNRDCKNEFHNV